MNIEQNIIALRMERQFLTRKANEAEYNRLYRDISPVQNVYWNGFGDPPSITFRAEFNDIEYNRARQNNRVLVKGRFQGGNVGFVELTELELFAGLYKKPIDKLNPIQAVLYELIEREGPLNIGQMKETTGFLVKEITPELHKLQEAFLIFEDQYDGEWDRGWYKFEDMFPDLNISEYTRHDALSVILKRFAYRHVFFDVKMAKSFYKLPEKEIKSAADDLIEQGELIIHNNGYILKSDLELLEKTNLAAPKSVFVLHRNDFLVKSSDHIIKEKFKHSEHDTLQYILLDGEFKGAVIGKFKNGPYILEDIALDLPDDEKISRKAEILAAVYQVNSRENSPLKKYCGVEE